MVDIRRGLSCEFISEFNHEYDKGTWLSELVNDNEIFTAIRNEYINFYSRGCRIIKLNFGKRNKFTEDIHYKYLLKPLINDPKPKNHYIKFNNVGWIKKPDVLPDLLVNNLNGNIKTLKKTVKLFAKEEKVQSYKIIFNNSNIIDTEIALGKGFIDLAVIKEGDKCAEINFYEVKLFENRCLRKQKDNPESVYSQMYRYSYWIKKKQDTLTESFQKVCKNIVELKGVGKGNKYSEDVMVLIKKVAAEKLELSIKCEPLLIVIQFDQDQQNSKAWNLHMERLNNVFGKRLLLVDDGKNVHLK